MTQLQLSAYTLWSSRDDYLPYLCNHRINPEFYLTSQAFERITPAEVAAVRQLLTTHSLSCTIHAPTAHMDTGSDDPAIQAATRQCVLQSLRLAQALQARLIVVHSGFDTSLRGAELLRWTKASISFWTTLMPRISASNCWIALENIYEDTPAVLQAVLEGVRHQRLRHCFDIGHFSIYASVALETWFAAMGRYCVECHLHDNNGSRDEHLPIGEGAIDFKRSLEVLRRHAPAAIWTLEAHSPEHLKRSYEALRACTTAAQPE
jgi:sugar phosphate isomerase/epimerase